MYFQDENENWYRLDTTTGVIEDSYGDDASSPIDASIRLSKDKTFAYYYEYVGHYWMIPKELRERLIAAIEHYKAYNITIDNIYCHGHVLGCLEMLENLNPLSITTVNNLDDDKIARLVFKYKKVPLAYVRACIAANKSLNPPDIAAFEALLEREGILEIEEIRERLLPTYYKLKVARGEALAAVRNVWHDLTKTMRKAEWYYEGNYKEGKE